MKVLYLDIFSGLSGDMFLGALLDLGVDFQRLQAELHRLGVTGYHLHCRRGTKAGIAGTQLEVHLESEDDEHGHPPAEGEAGATPDHAPPAGTEPVHTPGAAPPAEHVHADGTRHTHAPSPAPAPGAPQGHPDRHGRQPHRTFATIRALLAGSALDPWVRDRAIAVFQRIAEAEGRTHGCAPEAVHFHEVGAVDSIVDVVGACIALDLLGRPRVLAAPVVEGTGFLRCAHGRYPLPGPAMLAILGARGVAVTQCEEPHELVTPTGAAILAEFAESFGPMRGLIAERIGIGLGHRDHGTRPNVVRAILGEAGAAPGGGHDWEIDRVAVLETNLDDISSEILGHCVEQALGAGALDVFHTPVQMKKSRPGVLLTVLCAEADADRFAEWILRETTAFGVRRTVAERRKLGRRFGQVRTPWGDVVVKEGLLDGRVLHATPEYESCRQVAALARVSLREVYDAAARAAAPPTHD